MMQGVIRKNKLVKMIVKEELRGFDFDDISLGNIDKTEEESINCLILSSDIKNNFYVNLDECIEIPNKINSKLSLIIPLVAKELELFEKINLEIGELVIVTGEGLIPRLLSLCALWHGAKYVIHITAEKTYLPEIETIKFENLSKNVISIALNQKVNTTPGFVAIDTSGKANIIDYLLETLPVWGRLILMGNTEPQLTIDYYNNVHRKAADIVVTEFNIETIFDPNMKKVNSQYVKRSLRILMNDVFRKQLEKIRI
ncbi:MAG: hypothetical protein ACFFG0_11315 [Candidatus Thorarchaeota archaeon]